MTIPSYERWKKTRHFRLIVGGTFFTLAMAGYLAWWCWPPSPPKEIPHSHLMLTGEKAVKEDLASAVRDIEADPKSAERWGKYGMSLRAYLEHPEANQCFEVAAMLDPRDYRWPYLLAMHYAEADPALAVGWFQRAREADTKPAIQNRIVFRLLEALLALERVEEARKILGTPSPEEYRLRVVQAKIALARNQDREASQLLNEVPDESSVSRQLQLLRAELARRQGRESYSKLLSKRASETPEPEWPDELLDEIRARDLSRGGRLDAAAKLLRSGRPQDVERMLSSMLQEKTDARAFVAVAEARQMMGHFPGAVTLLHTAIQLDPKNLLANYQLGSLHFDRGEQLWAAQKKDEARKAFQESLSWLEKALDLNPTYASAILLKGIAYERFLDRHEDGVAFIRKFIDIRPQAMEGYLFLGEALAKVGKREAAITALTRSVELSAPSDRRAVDSLGRIKSELSGK